MKRAQRPEGYWQIVSRQFRNNRVATAGLIVVLLLFILAASADFIANDKPLLMNYRSVLYFPVLKDYAAWLGVSRWEAPFQNVSFKDFAATNFKQGDWAQFPPVRYSPNEVSLTSVLRTPSAKHFLGTDDIGRDIASHVVHGSRVALFVGFVPVSISVFIDL